MFFLSLLLPYFSSPRFSRVFPPHSSSKHDHLESLMLTVLCNHEVLSCNEIQLILFFTAPERNHFFQVGKQKGPQLLHLSPAPWSFVTLLSGVQLWNFPLRT